MEYPSSIMYACMKQFGGISNKELAKMLFSDRFTYGGTPVVARLEERSFLTRNIVHVAPGTYGENAFRDFGQQAERLCSLMFARHIGSESEGTVIEYFATTARDKMSTALLECGCNDSLYRNACGTLMGMNLSRLSDKAVLLVLLFIATGCLGDPARATDIALQYAQRIPNSTINTIVAGDVGTEVALARNGAVATMGLCRIVNGTLRMPPYPLANDANGTEIGSLTTALNAIHDVDNTVSKRHLRVYCGERGQWYAVGLGSTNGTTLIRASDGSRVVIEPPAHNRTNPANPVPIYPNDILRLAGTTVFQVMELA